MMGRLLFVATEDWFVRSHFLPMVRRAVADGWDVAIAARLSDAAGDLSATGARLIGLDAARGAVGPASIADFARQVGAAIGAYKPDVIHAIALKPALAVAVAALRTPVVLAVTGLGYLGVASGWRQKAMRQATFAALGARLAAGQAALLVENMDDARALAHAGLGFASDRIVLAPGAGIDPHALQPLPEPPAPPVVVGLAARMVRSKGVDVLVAAMADLASAGLTALIAGAPDPDNPASYAPQDLAAFAQAPNVMMLGAVSDIRSLWRRAHIACLPSIGGEGTPLSLIEAAAFGRPIVTTDTPGCRDLVRHEREGLLVAPGDWVALAQALRRLAQDGDLRARLAAAARARVASDYTHAKAADAAARAWARALS